MGNTPVHEVTVWRGDRVESRHRIHVAVVHEDAVLHSTAGDASIMAFARSAVKPVQALPLIDDGVADAFGFGSDEIAICCASHSGEPIHVSLALGILQRIGAGPESLACGAHAPFDEASAEALRASGESPSRLHNNCSGKHAGMLALARHHGWPLEGYHGAGHPVQRRMLAEMAQWGGVDAGSIATAVDGCGVVTFGMSVRSYARMFAALSLAAHRREAAPARVVDAMIEHPYVVAGNGRMCTALMAAARGRVFAKVGAEGVYCAGVPDAGLGIALKVEDGAVRAAEPALLHVLHALGVLDDSQMSDLVRWSAPVILNTRSERVGHIATHIDLVAAS